MTHETNVFLFLTSRHFLVHSFHKNALANMMSNISKSVHLSKNYTNHCVRATCITVLSESGFEARHIVIDSLLIITRVDIQMLSGSSYVCSCSKR
jgi:hypothetical protein